MVWSMRRCLYVEVLSGLLSQPPATGSDEKDGPQQEPGRLQSTAGVAAALRWPLVWASPTVAAAWHQHTLLVVEGVVEAGCVTWMGAHDDPVRC